MKVWYNFFWFLWRLFKNRKNDFSILSKEEQQQRLDICMDCPLLDKKTLLTKIKGPRCGVCGCFIHYKKRYAFEICPDKPPRWPEIKQS